MWVEKVKSLAEENNLPIRKLAIQIGMSENNLYKCFNRNSIEVKHLEKIAQVLKVPVAAFFSESKNYPTDNRQTIFQVKEASKAYGKDAEESKENLQKEIARLHKELNTCQTKLIRILEKKSK
jgi:transcriptional regulator with XRE-family HTH domain